MKFSISFLAPKFRLLPLHRVLITGEGEKFTISREIRYFGAVLLGLRLRRQKRIIIRAHKKALKALDER